MTIDDIKIGTTFADVQTIGGPPSISGLVAISIPAGSNTGPMPFLVTDVETAPGNLTVAATSDNTTLVPNNPANLTFGGSGANRTLTVTPAGTLEGTANIEVVVTDENSEKATNTFMITVGEPRISTIANQVVLTNVVLGPIPFSVNDNETSPGSLPVTGTSSDQYVVPDANIFIENAGGTNRNLYVTNIGPGACTITLTVNDSVFTRSSSFVLNVSQNLGVILSDDFSYDDGSVVTNSASLAYPLWPWVGHSSPGTNSAMVLGGKLLTSYSGAEDVNRWFDSPYYAVATNSGLVLYSRFVVKVTALPTQGGVGEYFAHFKESGNSQFRARVFATTNGAAPGKFRFSIANGGFATTAFPQDLNPGASHVVITRYNTATAQSTLWVNPATGSESEPSVTSTELTTPVTIYSYAFRQNSGIGAFSIDGLRIATSFAEVYTSTVPSSDSITPSVSDTNLVLNWTDSSYALASSTNVAGAYRAIPAATSPYTNAITGPQKFFRLVWP